MSHLHQTQQTPTFQHARRDALRFCRGTISLYRNATLSITKTILVAGVVGRVGFLRAMFAVNGVMKLVVVTPIRLFGEGLASCFSHCVDISLQATVCDLIQLRQCLQTMEVDIVLIDVTQGIDLDDVRAIASERTDLALVALGLREERGDVVRCGRAGFSGYVDRNASIEGLCQALSDVSSGRLACSAEISGGLLRALFGIERHSRAMELDEALTRREGEVLQLIGQGLSNKEIARHLRLSLATVKHHVHHILQKLKLPRRAQAMRRVREMPWIASSAPSFVRHQDFD